MKLKHLVIMSALLPCLALASTEPNVYKDQVAVTGGIKNLTQILEGCEAHSGLFKAKTFQYSDSGRTIKLIQFVRGDGEVFAIPTNFEKLTKAQYSDAQGMLHEGQKYWISFSVCGSGGYMSLMDISYTLGM